MSNIESNETCPAELPNFCAQRHWSIFWILIICSVTVVAGRAITVHSDNARGDSPFFSANDRSRWCTIRALGDHGVYEIDDVIKKGQPIDWDTIDKVQHIGEDGELHFYSSKPTLLPTLMAGVYKVIKTVSGKDLANDTKIVVPVMLLLVNVLPWAVYLFFMAKLINSIPVRDWTRYYVLACAGFGTYLSTFTNTLSNHLPAAISVVISLYFLSEIWRRETRVKENPGSSAVSWIYYLTCGLFAAFAAANELPALSFFALAGLFCFFNSPKKTFVAFVPGAMLVVAGFFGTNYLAHQEWEMPYQHRGDGDVVATISGDFENELNQGFLPEEFRDLDDMDFSVPDVTLGQWPSSPEDEQRWVVRDKVSASQMSIVRKIGSANFEVRAWENWYDYPGSYWLAQNDENKSEVDRGQPSRLIYAFHVLFGHHGIFSLTPIWLLSLAGMIALACGVKIAGRFQMRWLGLLGVSLSVVVIAFYLRRPEMDRNYGGVTSALRWVFWLAPIWLVSMLPVVDWLAKSKSGKFFCYALFALSAVSALYSMNNPWVHPWLYEVWDLTGLPK